MNPASLRSAPRQKIEVGNVHQLTGADTMGDHQAEQLKFDDIPVFS